MKPQYTTSVIASSLYSLIIVVWIVSEETVLVRTIRSLGVGRMWRAIAEETVLPGLP
jgi:hypothetical protein